MRSKHYLIKSDTVQTWIKTWDTGCIIIKKTGNTYQCEDYDQQYKKQDGDVLTEIDYRTFKSAFMLAYSKHLKLSLN